MQILFSFKLIRRIVTVKDVSTGKTTTIYDAKEELSGLKTPVVKDPKVLRSFVHFRYFCLSHDQTSRPMNVANAGDFKERVECRVGRSERGDPRKELGESEGSQELH